MFLKCSLFLSPSLELRVEDQVILSSSGFQETSTDSNHLEDLVALERVEIDTNSPPEVLIFDIKIISSFYQNFNIHYFFLYSPFLSFYI